MPRRTTRSIGDAGAGLASTTNHDRGWGVEDVPTNLTRRLCEHPFYAEPPVKGPARHRQARRDAGRSDARDLLAGEFQATYDGPDHATYIATLGTWLARLGGSVEDGPAGAAATIDGRRIAIRFGP
jgi:hypothetical protein